MEFFRFWTRGLVIIAINSAVLLLVFPWIPVISGPTIAFVVLAMLVLIAPLKAVGGSIGRILLAAIAYLAATFWALFGVMFVTKGEIFFAADDSFQPTASSGRRIELVESDFSSDYGFVFLLHEPIRPFVLRQLSRRGIERIREVKLRSRGTTNFAELPLFDVILIKSETAFEGQFDYQLYVPHSSSVLNFEIVTGEEGHVSIGFGISHKSSFDILSSESSTIAPWHWVVLKDATHIDEIEYAARLSLMFSEVAHSRHVRALSLLRQFPAQSLADLEIARLNLLRSELAARVAGGAIGRLQRLSIDDTTFGILLAENNFDASTSPLRSWLTYMNYWQLLGAAGEEDERTETLRQLISKDRGNFVDLYQLWTDAYDDDDQEYLDEAIDRFDWKAKTRRYLYQFSRQDLEELPLSDLVEATKVAAAAEGDNNCVAAFRLWSAYSQELPNDFSSTFFESILKELFLDGTMETIDNTTIRELRERKFHAWLDDHYFRNFSVILEASQSLAEGCSSLHEWQLRRAFSGDKAIKGLIYESIDPFFYPKDYEKDESDRESASKYIEMLTAHLSDESTSERILKKLFIRMQSFIDRVEDDDPDVSGFEERKSLFDQLFGSIGESKSYADHELPWWRFEYQLFVARETINGLSFAKGTPFLDEKEGDDASEDLDERPKTIEALQKEMRISLLIRDGNGKGVKFVPGMISSAIATEEIAPRYSLSLKRAVERHLNLEFEESARRLLPDYFSNLENEGQPETESSESAFINEPAERYSTSFASLAERAASDNLTPNHPIEPYILANSPIERVPVIVQFSPSSLKSSALRVDRLIPK